jgi:rare lipoprotein A
LIVSSARARCAAGLIAIAVLLSGCPGPQRQPEPPAAKVPGPPADIDAIPDAVPRVEPRSRGGNPPFYDVLGKRYFVLAKSEGHVERGVASWYGPGFHNARTSNGESYDMYAMTAAHKTLPLPCYARVTNLSNGRSVVVRINDRGPFVGNRVIDLSYTAAAKLDMLKAGTAFVEVRVVTPQQPAPLDRATQSPAADLYIQAGAFADPANARKLAAKLRAAGIGDVVVRSPPGSSRLHRVRVGPVGSVADFDRIAARLTALGAEAMLALD